MGLNALFSTFIFIGCMYSAKKLANRHHPKWGLYGILLGMGLAIFISVIQVLFNIIPPEISDYSLQAYLKDLGFYIILIISTIVFFRLWMIRIKNKPLVKKPKPFKKALRVSQILMLLLGISVIIHLVFTDVTEISDMLHVQIDNGILIMSWLTGFGYIVHLRKRSNLDGVEDILKRDTRPPVLFLRSFESEDVRLRYAKIKSFKDMFMTSVKLMTGITFDEFLEPEISKNIGPMIALGKPGDFLPMAGAARSYVHDDNWQQTIAGYSKQASVIIFLESITEGAKWELEHIRQNLNPDKLFIVTFPKKFQTKRNSWNHFQEILNNSGILLSKEDPGYGAVIHIQDNWEGEILKLNCKSAKEYSQSILDKIQYATKLP